MSTSPLYRVTSNIARKQYQASADIAGRHYRVGADMAGRHYRASADVARKQYRAATDIARKHSRASLIASSVAAAGVLGAAGFAVGAAPWAQAAGNVAGIVQGDKPSGSGQLGASFFQALGGDQAQNSKPLASGPLDILRHTATTDGAGAAKHAPASQQAAAAPAQPAQKQVAKQQPAKHQAVAKAPAKAKPAARHKAAKPKAHAAAAEPYLIYDSVKPKTIPNGKQAAVYVNGAYAAFPSQLGGRHSVLWIDTNGSDPAANVLDVEPGDATPAGAAQWVKQRLSSQPKSVAIVYTMKNDWQQVKDNVAALPGWMQSRVRYWIADPTGVPHVVAGASATQWYWGNSYDITTANPDFVK